MVRSEILPANPDVLEGADDLNKLCYLNEPEQAYIHKSFLENILTSDCEEPMARSNNQV